MKKSKLYLFSAISGILVLVCLLVCCLSSCGSPLVVPTMEDFVTKWHEEGEKHGYTTGYWDIEIKEDIIQSNESIKFFSASTKRDDGVIIGAYNSDSRSFALGYQCHGGITTAQAETSIKCLASTLGNVSEDTIKNLQEKYNSLREQEKPNSLREKLEESRLVGFILLVTNNSEDNAEMSVKLLHEKEDAIQKTITTVKEAQYMQLSQENIENKIITVLNKTKVNPNFAPTIGAMVPKVFYTYDITWEPYQNSLTRYSVTISGDYCPNPDIQNLSMSGSITYLVDIDSGRCAVLDDPKNIASTFLVFIVN